MLYDEMVKTDDVEVRGWISDWFSNLKDNLIGKWIFNLVPDFTDPDALVKCIERLISLIQACNYFKPNEVLSKLEQVLKRILNDVDLFNLFFWALKNAYNVLNKSNEGVLFEEIVIADNVNPEDVMFINILSSEIVKVSVEVEDK